MEIFSSVALGPLNYADFQQWIYFNILLPAFGIIAPYYCAFLVLRFCFIIISVSSSFAALSYLDLPGWGPQGVCSALLLPALQSVTGTRVLAAPQPPGAAFQGECCMQSHKGCLSCPECELLRSWALPFHWTREEPYPQHPSRIAVRWPRLLRILLTWDKGVAGKTGFRQASFVLPRRRGTAEGSGVTAGNKARPTRGCPECRRSGGQFPPVQLESPQDCKKRTAAGGSAPGDVAHSLPAWWLHPPN